MYWKLKKLVISTVQIEANVEYLKSINNNNNFI